MITWKIHVFYIFFFQFRHKNHKLHPRNDHMDNSHFYMRIQDNIANCDSKNDILHPLEKNYHMDNSLFVHVRITKIENCEPKITFCTHKKVSHGQFIFSHAQDNIENCDSKNDILHPQKKMITWTIHVFTCFTCAQGNFGNVIFFSSFLYKASIDSYIPTCERDITRENISQH